MALDIGDGDEENEAFLIHEIARQMRTAFDRRCQALHLTRAQWHALAILRRRQGIKQAALAQILEIEPISLARLLDRMEAAGMIERRADPADRRANLIYFTPKVAGTIAQMRGKALSLRKEALEGFTAAEHKQLLALLRRVKVNVGSMMEEAEA